MTPMEPEENKIKEMVTALDKIIPKEGGKISFQIYGGGPDESRLVANKIGYYRLGLELLKAGFKPATSLENQNSENIDVDLDDLTSEKSEIYFDWFQRTEDWPEKKIPKTARWKSMVTSWSIVITLAIGVLMALVGLVTTAAFIFKNLN